MSVDQIEHSMRNDTVWDRPSWPLKGSYKDGFDEFNIHDEQKTDLIESCQLHKESG